MELKIDISLLPIGTVSVPVLMDDNRTEYDGQMVVGQLASEVLPGDKVLKPRSDSFRRRAFFNLSNNRGQPKGLLGFKGI